MSSRRESEFDPIDEVVLTPLAEAARRTATEDAGPGPTPAVWHRLQGRRAHLPRAGRGWWLMAVGAAAAFALVASPRLLRRSRPLTYAVEQSVSQPSVPGAPPAPSETETDGYIRGGAAGTNVRFSDGTRIDLRQGARLSVLSRESDGARLRVEDGEAHFEVVHRSKTAWSVEAGPFVVYVTGTKFDVRWSGSDETVEVRLREGSVKVGGPLLPERVTLRSGQRLVAHLASGELRIDEGRAAEPAQSQAPAPRAEPGAVLGTASGSEARPQVESGARPQAGAEAPAAVGEAPLASAEPAFARGGAATVNRVGLPHRPRARARLASGARGFAPSSWGASVAAGDGGAVVAEAEAHGVERTLAEVDGPAMAALADAARYAGRRDLAVRVLLAERSRFPRTPPAQVAAFLLGRLADDRGEAPAALEWYRRYLAEAPRGPYAAEALGREMLTVERLADRAQAQELAAEYVRRFPNGTYLLQAHSILANP